MISVHCVRLFPQERDDCAPSNARSDSIPAFSVVQPRSSDRVLLRSGVVMSQLLQPLPSGSEIFLMGRARTDPPSSSLARFTGCSSKHSCGFTGACYNPPGLRFAGACRPHVLRVVDPEIVKKHGDRAFAVAQLGASVGVVSMSSDWKLS